MSEAVIKVPTPLTVDDVTMAFGGDMKRLLPAFDSIPDEFKHHNNPWCQLVSRWFFSGLHNTTFVPKNGIDQQVALRHIKTIMGSFEPKHEHKEAACAYLLASWFQRVEHGEDHKTAPEQS